MTKSISIKRTMLFFIAFVVLMTAFILSSSLASAESGSGGTISAEKRAEIEKKQKERQSSRGAEMEKHKADIEAKKAEIEAKHEENKEKLADKKLENCKKKETRINTSMQKIADRKTKQLEVFNKIADRTIAFYEEKGLTLANYDALVTDVDAKRAAAEAEIANLKTSTVDFKCDTEDPLKVSDVFKQAREGSSAALKAYKTSVKNLIVGVKSVSSTDVKKDGDQ